MKLDRAFADELSGLRKMTSEFAAREIAPRAAEIDEAEEISAELMDRFRQVGLLSLLVPEELGGAGGGILHMTAVAEELARVDVSSATTFNTQCSCTALIDRLASDDQRTRLLSRVVEGALLSIALSEPEAGSDAAGIRTSAVRDGDRYILNGVKHYCTNGDVADILLVFAVTDPGKRAHGISLFAVDRTNPGVHVRRREKKMGLHGTTTVEFELDQCYVPVSDRLGAENAGFGAGMQVLQRGRVGIAAVAVGLATGALQHATQHAQMRVQFGRPISSFQGLQFKLADIAIEVEAARALVSYAANLGEQEDPAFGVVSAKAKCFATDVSMRATTEAVQVFGGAGYMRGMYVERAMRDAKILQIFEGTNEVMRMLVARDLVGRT
jgi:butyryl-CoA dehydrogenase